MLQRIRERMQVKVEHEMRELPESHAHQVERLIPVIEQMVKDHEGRRDLAGICAAYLAEHRPETTILEEDTLANDEAAQRTPGERRAEGGRGRKRSGGGGGGSRRGGGGGGGNRSQGGGRRRR
jgi:uncharacterized membrane protein YgcG